MKANREQRRHSKKAQLERERERAARKEAADERIAANPKLVRHKFRKV